MIVERLRLVNVRAITEAEFEFSGGMNLLVGINGVGKSTVLDSLRFLFANALSKLSSIKENIDFKDTDLSIGQDFLMAEFFGKIENEKFNYLIHKPRQDFVVDEKKAGEVRGGVITNPSHNDFIIRPAIKPNQIKPIAVFFSPNRSVVSLRKSNKTAPFAIDSLEPRELQIQDFANWLLTLEALSKESNKAKAQLKALENTVSVFLGNCRDLRAEKDPKPTLLIEKNGKTLDVSQLSDGERGVLSLVLDLTFRLTQVNPNWENPVRDGKAVVLIDELDLHLHPKWQREIVERLEKTFPNCQFIATTHSPQIVGEVPPEKIYILPATGEKAFKPQQSLGMNTNWVLEHLMETSERKKSTEKELQEIADLIESEEYEKAQYQLDELRKYLKGDDQELIRLQARIDRFSLLKE
jgi:predicted ATP-binding protein involved in virulence